MTTLLLAEHDNARLNEATAKALSAAAKLGGDVHVLVAGKGAGAVAAEAAKLAGVAKVLLAESDALEHGLAEPLAALIVSLAGPYDALVAPATTAGKNVMPRVAALLDVMQVSDVMEVLGPDTFRRPSYAGNAIQTVQSSDAKKVLTIRTASFQAAEQGSAAAPVENVAPAADPGLSTFVEESVAANERPELASAKIIISGGRALGSTRKIHGGDPAGRRQARRGGRRLARGGGRRLCAERLAGRPDRQDRRAGPLHRLRHFGRHPAPRRHEGFARSSSPSTRTPRRRSSRSPITAWSATSSRSCRSCRRNWRNARQRSAEGERSGDSPSARFRFGRACGILATERTGSSMTARLNKIGVIGAGQMGNGIAHVCALAGYKVLLNDVSEERVQAGLATIDGNLARQVGSGRITEADRKAALGRIEPALSLEALADADLVIETVTENETVKRKIFAELCPLLNPEAILATNTSSISITRLAAATDRPERFIGMHFMNPVPVMELVELVRGIATDDQTFETAKAFVAKLGKKAAVAEDFPAFMVNRILLPMINEAIYVLYEGVGTVEAIDTAMKLGANHPMGPLALADFIGLDTCLSIMQMLYEGLADSKYRPCPLLVKYVEAGWLGRKTNRGFYDYRGARRCRRGSRNESSDGRQSLPR